MGYLPTTRSRAYREGWTGRRRNYHCRRCGQKFQHDGGQLPEGARLCPAHLKDPERDRAFELRDIEVESAKEK